MGMTYKLSSCSGVSPLWESVRATGRRAWARYTARQFTLSVIASAGVIRSAALAQDVAPVARLGCFQDSLSAMAAAPPLRQLEQLNQGAGAWVSLRRGLVQLRLAELGAEDGYSHAARSFKRAIEADSGSAYAWLGLGTAQLGKARQAREQPLNIGTRVGAGDVRRALAALRIAIVHAPGLTRAAVLLATASHAVGDSADVTAALPLIRSADVAASGNSAELSLWRGRLEEDAGELDSAAAAFARYGATGGSHSLSALEVARARLAEGDTSAARLYYAAADSADSAVMDELRADLEYVAPDSIVAHFDDATPRERSALVRQFWQSRDYEELRPLGSRLSEHLQRLVFARRHFRLIVSKRVYPPRDAYRGRNIGLDDRGVVYLRLGEPDLRLQPTVPRAMPNETWVYRRPEGDLLLHFSSGGDTPRASVGDRFDYGGDLSDYHLVNSVMDLHGAEDAPRDVLLASRDSASDLYRKMATYLPVTAAQIGRDERQIGAQSVHVATTTDDNRLRFARPLQAEAQIASVGSSPAGGLVHLILAVRRAPPRAWQRLRVRFALVGRNGSLGGRVDTTISVPASPSTNGDWIVARVPVNASEGTWNVYLALSAEDSTGAILSPGQLTVASPSAGFGMSSLVLEDPSIGLVWSDNSGDAIQFTPFATVERKTPLRVFYQVYGAITGDNYKTRISLARLKRDDQFQDAGGVTVAFNDRANTTGLRARRSVDLSRLSAGRYVLEVRVTAPSGRTATRAKLIEVR